VAPFTVLQFGTTSLSEEYEDARPGRCSLLGSDGSRDGVRIDRPHDHWFSFIVVVGLVMALVGVWRPGLSGAWGFLAGFGGLPALVFLSHIVAGLRTVLNPYCDQRGPGTTIPPPVGPVERAYIPSSYIRDVRDLHGVGARGGGLGTLPARPFAPLRRLGIAEIQASSPAGRPSAPGRTSLWYFLMADLRVLKPRVALRVRLPITSLPSSSTNAP
jgi:hypothetical protein